jgi:hypothetical protein
VADQHACNLNMTAVAGVVESYKHANTHKQQQQQQPVSSSTMAYS